MHSLETIRAMNADLPAPPSPAVLPPKPAACSCEEAEWLRGCIALARKALMEEDRSEGYRMTIESVAECDRLLGAALDGEGE